MDNANSTEYLDKIKNQVFENLKRTAFAPSVQMTDVPRHDLTGGDDVGEVDAELDDLDADQNPDVRITERVWDNLIHDDRELSDTEDDVNAAERYAGVRRPREERRRGIMDYQNPNAVPDDILDSGMASGLGTPQRPVNGSQNGDADMNGTGLSALVAAASPTPAAASLDTTSNTLSVPTDARKAPSPSVQSQRGSPVPPPSAANTSAPGNEDLEGDGDADITMDDGLAEETAEETALVDPRPTPPASPPAPVIPVPAQDEPKTEDVDMADADEPDLPHPTIDTATAEVSADAAVSSMSEAAIDPTAATSTGDPIIGATAEPKAMTGTLESATVNSAAVAAAKAEQEQENNEQQYVEARAAQAEE
ncbi:MAG: hypothetical protein Q9157_009020, partial [Trypethelium eluteriae]